VNPNSGVINCSTKVSVLLTALVTTVRSLNPVGSSDNCLNPVSSTTESLKKYICPDVIPSLPDVPLLPLVPEEPLVPPSPPVSFKTKSLSVIPV